MFALSASTFPSRPARLNVRSVSGPTIRTVSARSKCSAIRSIFSRSSCQSISTAPYRKSSNAGSGSPASWAQAAVG